MRQRWVEPAGSRPADLRRGLVAPTLTVAAVLADPRLTHNPSMSTVEPKNASYLGDVGWYLKEWPRTAGHKRFLITAPPLRLTSAVGSPVTPVVTV